MAPPPPAPQAEQPKQDIAKQADGQDDPQPNEADNERDSIVASDQESESTDDLPVIDGVQGFDDEQDPPATVTVAEPPRYFTIGALDPRGLYKNVVTLSSLGATVQRVELNSKRKNGKLLFKDLEYLGAYIGHLEFRDAGGVGAEVNVVPPGTPAALAGLQIGDVITNIGGEPIGDVVQLLKVLEDTEPGGELDVKLLREDQVVSVVMTTMETPLALIGPSSETTQFPGDRLLKSFQISLHVQQGGVRDKWPELDETLRTGNWDAEVIGQDEVHFKRTLTKSLLKPFGIEGPIEVTKIYRATMDQPESRNHDNYHFEMEIEIRNLGSQPQAVNLQMIGPTNTSIEGWWYQHKIHGRSSAVFYTAGARDIIVSTVGVPFSFWGGPEIINKFISDHFAFVVDPSRDKHGRTVQYAAVDTHYFTVAMLPVPSDPESSDSGFTCFSGFALPASEIPSEKKYQRLTDLTFQLFSEPVILEPFDETNSNQDYRQSFKIFAGPKENHVLAQYGLEDCRTFGWFAIFSKPLIWLLGVFYSIIPNYGLAIILLTFLVRLAMMPISRKAAKSALMMQYLQPEMKKIAEKYKDDFQKRGEAQNALLKKYNCHPLGGCMLMFVQLPIFIGLYRGLSVDIGLRDKSLIPGLNWCSNLAGPDQLFYWKSWGLPFLFDESGWLGPYFNILPIFTVVLFLIQQKLFTPPPTDDQQRMMHKMMTFMMLFMGVLFFKVSSGLCIYFITSSIWGILERKLIPKPSLPDHMTNKEEADNAEEATEKVRTTKSTEVYTRENKRLQDRRKLDKDRKKRLKDRN